MINTVITVSDLMTILCDCVDSGTLDLNSEIAIDANNISGVNQQSYKVKNHKVIYREDTSDNYLVLIPENL